jgi:hypothetical protein
MKRKVLHRDLESAKLDIKRDIQHKFDLLKGLLETREKFLYQQVDSLYDQKLCLTSSEEETWEKEEKEIVTKLGKDVKTELSSKMVVLEKEIKNFGTLIKGHTCPKNCKIEGLDKTATKGTFNIIAYNENGEKRISGGDVFKANLRNVMILDNKNGTYKVSYNVEDEEFPDQKCKLQITLQGANLDPILFRFVHDRKLDYTYQWNFPDRIRIYSDSALAASAEYLFVANPSRCYVFKVSGEFVTKLKCATQGVCVWKDKLYLFETPQIINIYSAFGSLEKLSQICVPLMKNPKYFCIGSGCLYISNNLYSLEKIQLNSSNEVMNTTSLSFNQNVLGLCFCSTEKRIYLTTSSTLFTIDSQLTKIETFLDDERALDVSFRNSFLYTCNFEFLSVWQDSKRIRKVEIPIPSSSPYTSVCCVTSWNDKVFIKTTRGILVYEWK